MSNPLAAAETAVRAGDPKAALEALTAAVKAAPAKPALRVFLAQLLCVLGQWQRAHTQLNVAAEMDATTGPMREMVGHALRCEKIRAAVFAGRKTPMVFGHPDPWLALLIESMLRAAEGNPEAVAELAAQAFDQAPTTPGTLDGQPFEWIADADSRLGPVLEAMVNGRYYWVPFSRLSAVRFEPAVDLRDRVWIPANLTFANGGEAIAMIPSRYPGSEASTDGQILMAAKTEWLPLHGDRFAGLGQRVLVTDIGEHDLLSIRELVLQPAASGEATDHDG
ncbi:MAG TPA: type VI secretion system accessory protein TagJ [Rubrivivax sp.]|nr:type VI secretion system accessory protein TagJ [Rubrivivax sp.]